MSESTYTHKDLATRLGVSETTIKSYRRKFPGCIPVANQGKPIRFTAKALAVAKRIRDLFETGMSVNEVRVRLAGEFEWISEQNPESGEQKQEARKPEKNDLAPELTLGVSNMAKSMVAMTQQQKAIIARMQGIESMLEDLGLQKTAPVGEGGSTRNAAREREQALETRLDQLDANTKTLARVVHGLADQLSRFLGKRDKAADEWSRNSVDTMATAAQIAARTTSPTSTDQSSSTHADPRSEAENAMPDSPENSSAPQEAPGDTRDSGASRVIPLHSAAKAAPSRQQSNLVPGQSGASDGPAEPPRQLLSLPLVVRTEQGQYISAGGKSRGRFSLNDLKAMLIYGFTPPDHFTLRWERHGQGWWLYLEQERSDRAIHLLLMELPTQKGGHVAEILQIRHQGETLHPAEFCSLIDSFGA